MQTRHAGHPSFGDGQERLQGALGTVGLAVAAVVLAGVDNQRVVFVVKRRVRGEVLLELGTDFFVARFRVDEVMALEDAPCVGVNDEHAVLPSVQEDGVGGFWADAVDGQELLAKFGGGRGEKLVEGASMPSAEKADEGLQLASFLAEIAGAANQLGEARSGDFFNGRRGKEPFAAKAGDGALHVGPGGVLGQDGADDDFEAGAAGPPVLRAVGAEKCIEVSGEW